MVTPLETSTSTRIDVDVREDDETRTGEPHVAHIVNAGEGDAVAKVMEARIQGTPVTALCGHIWVPQRDPTRLPLCSKCKDIYEAYRVFDADRPELPPA